MQIIYIFNNVNLNKSNVQPRFLTISFFHFLDDLIIANVPAYISSVYIGTTINKITIIGITLTSNFQYNHLFQYHKNIVALLSRLS